MNYTEKRFKVKLTMLSDWHVGTGAGRPGSVDKLIARDANGFPFIPAKTLNGIWRDALETLTLGLDNGGRDENGNPKYEWQKFVELVFGVQPNQIDAKDLGNRLQNKNDTYSFSLLSVQPACLNKDLRDKIDSFEPNEPVNDEAAKEKKRLGKIQKQKYLSALTFIKPGVAIDGASGTSKPDFLRFEEMGRSGTVLEAACELSYCDETIWALLVASAKLVERIGGKRRRGAGRCKLEVLNANGKEIEHLQSYKDKAAPIAPQPKQQPKNEFDLTAAQSFAEWQTLEFKLTLQTPVSIVTATLGNVSESLDFIPGTYLLPHFTKVIGKQLGAEFFHAVAYGDFQVSPATVEINGKRGLPVPKVLGLKKVGGSFSEKGTAFNKFTDENPNNWQITNLRAGYVSEINQSGKLPIYQKPKQTLLMHNTVKDDIQRPHEDVGGVFSRAAIAAGTVLRGEIRTRSQKLFDQISSELNKEKDIRLGASRKDDYGLATLTLFKRDQDEDKDNPAHQSAKLISTTGLTVYFESDVLLRNGNLRQTNLVEDLAKEIGNKLGTTLKKKELTEEEKKEGKTNSLIQTRRIESWHEGWGFPRPTLIALSAGSCVVFEIEKFDSFDKAKRDEIESTLQTLEAQGIGERRGEGYGRLRFNPSLVTLPINTWSPAGTSEKEGQGDQDNQNDEPLSEDSFVNQVEETVWREEIKIAVLKIAADENERNKIFSFDLQDEKPPMSQIGGLRSVMSRLQKFSDDKLVRSWLGHLKETPNRRDRWSKDKQRAEDKLDGIAKVVAGKNEVWRIFKEAKIAGKSVWQKPAALTGRNLEEDEQLWAEAVRSLFDACARAHKRDLEDKEQKRNG